MHAAVNFRALYQYAPESEAVWLCECCHRFLLREDVAVPTMAAAAITCMALTSTDCMPSSDFDDNNNNNG